ncbi:hypothetical protein [Halobacillus litoralis]|uniref:Uncharacterized protein n=1 Tax=Halobacillus litoralis TaxID=45668 RepID=A0A410MBX7_9BACI|nr:hypothetical protein [Halobacillus litoralis]QAS52156.1 hypothetical protein HLI_07905 [Halobacillus litoralis]
MNTFEQNYWSLYLDFLEDFKDLNYKGYSIAYLCHYRSLLNKDLKAAEGMAHPAFSKNLRNNVKNTSEVQAKFSAFKALHQKPLKKNTDGKVIFHDVYKLLRFPNETFAKYFDSKSILLFQERGRAKQRVSKSKTQPKTSKKKIKKNKKKNPKKRTSSTMKRTRRNVKGKQVVKQVSMTPNYFDSYQINNKAAISKMKQKATGLINTFKGHPVYSDEIFRKRFFIQIAKIINRIEEAGKLFRSVPVTAVVVPSTHYPESRTLVMVAAAHGIPTICMQHGIISGEFGYLPKIADYDAVYGPFEVDWYRKNGISKKAMEIIGHPRFDMIHSAPKLNKEKLAQKLGAHPKKRNVLVIVRGNNQLKSWKKFLAKLRSNKNLNIIVKDFPNSKPHKLSKTHSSILSAHGCQLYDLIQFADVVVSYSSTVGLEAILAKKPVFILNEPFPGYSGYYTSLGKLVQKDPGVLAELVLDFFKSDQMKNYTYSKMNKFLAQSYSTKQSSGRRLADLIQRFR